jgi:hypothetical protein
MACSVEVLGFFGRVIHMIWFCLGDRFDRCWYGRIPFGVKFAHIHGGGNHIGSDRQCLPPNYYSIILHFTATDVFKDKVMGLIESQETYIV